MSVNFAEAAKGKSNLTTTENGAVALTTTGSALIDLFGVIGAMRTRGEEDILSMFKAAFKEDRTLAIKMLFYCRDCRGGLGERRTFKTILRWLAAVHPEIIRKNLDNIVYYGRWDDLYALVATPCEKDMWNLIRAQWIEDAANYRKGKPISIMTKWLKSCNTSSPASRAMGRRTAIQLGLREPEYRRALSRFRAHLNVCERNMSAKEWQKIVYSEVPSYAMKRYRAAFDRNDTDRFTDYRIGLQRKMDDGTISSKDIKSTVMYPMDIVHEYFTHQDKNFAYRPTLMTMDDPILEAQWQTLPNYITGENNILVMADVSGSMMGNNMQPIAASIGLATYFAERNHGAYHNLYMSFSSFPSFLSLDGHWTLRDKINAVMATEVGYSTNLEKAFREILNMAKINRIAPEDMPKALVVISDMEIDSYGRDSSAFYFLNEMGRQFAAAGYELPRIVMWNVEARANHYHATVNDQKVKFVSGFSASTFRDIIKTLDSNPYDSMVEILMDERYERVKI